MSRLDDEAAAALYALANQPLEHMGALYGDDLARSNIVSSNAKGGVRGRIKLDGPLRALFHNHPDAGGRHDSLRKNFSQDDKDRLGVPSYISAGDRVRRYDPATGDTRDVLHKLPIEEIKRQIMIEVLGRGPDDPRGAMR